MIGLQLVTEPSATDWWVFLELLFLMILDSPSKAMDQLEYTI